MDDADQKAVLHHYLQRAREALLWKLDGLSEYDGRRPLTATATNLLGIVQHVASVEAGYFGDCCGRPFPEPFPWFDDDAEPNADMWVEPHRSRTEIIELYHRVWAHSDATIESLPLEAPATVPWWGDEGEVTLQRLLVHMVAETNRHAGHADLVRELIDGRVGLRDGMSNLPGDLDAAWWEDYRARVEQAARDAGSG